MSFVDYRQDEFPLLLNHIHDGPLLLFYRGKPFPRSDKIVSIVGTRKPTKDALVFTKTIVESIQHVNPIIVSGLAEGIDVGAHQAALDAGLQTYACLSHGVNQCYPAFHKKIKATIEKEGGCLTEHPPLTPPYTQVIFFAATESLRVFHMLQSLFRLEQGAGLWSLDGWLLTIIVPCLPFREVQTTLRIWGAISLSKEILLNCLTRPPIFLQRWVGKLRQQA